MTHAHHRDSAFGLLNSLRNPEHLHGHRQALRFSGIVLVYLVAVYLITTRWLPVWLRSSPNLNFYVVQPILWTGLTLLAYYGWRRVSRRPDFHWVATRAGLLVGIFHVSILVIAGVLAGFGRSGSAGKLINYPLNTLYLGTMLVGLETARAYLLSAWFSFLERAGLILGGSRAPVQALRSAAFAAITFIFFVAVTPVGQFAHLDDPTRLFRTGAGSLVPALVLSGVATWMVGLGGPGPPIAYRGLLIAFAWFSPILPDLEWVWLLLIGSITPLVSMSLFRGLAADVLGERHVPAAQEASERRSWPGWVATAIVGLLGIAFFTGLFGVRPLVVAGISMEPALERGDVVIVREGIDATDLRVDDIIKYERGTLPVTHRIVRIEEASRGLVITTKGDNNHSPDPAIDAKEVDGKVVFAIPWIGRVALWVRDR